MASESEGVPPQPVRPDDVKSSGGQPVPPSNPTPEASPTPVGRDSVEPHLDRSEASAASISAEPSQPIAPAGPELPASPLGTVSQSTAPAVASPNPEGFPSAELGRTPPVGDPSSAPPADPSGAGPHEPAPYHQEHQHDYTGDHHSGDPHHDPYHADHHSGEHHDEYSQQHSSEYQYPVYTPPPPEEEHGFVKAVRSVTSVLKSDDDHTGEGGGPVKPFLDHLEDLRWMLIKVSVSVLVAMMACLVGADWLVKVLIWPLKEARIQSQQEALKSDKPPERVPVMFDTNRIGTFQLQLLGIDPKFNHTNQQGHVQSVHLVPVDIGTNKILGLQLSTNAPAATDPLVELLILGPMDVIWITLDLALYGGLVIAAPFVFFFLGQFILPALRMQEKQLLKPFAIWGTVLFVSGVVFCYFIILPLMLRMTVEFSQWLGFSSDQWRAQEYLSMVPKFLLATGLSFEMPVIILTIVKIGLLDSKKLVWFRPYFVVLNLFVCAVVSPSGDPVTMFVMAAPLCVLYEACIIIARFWEWRDRRREAAKPADPA